MLRLVGAYRVLSALGGTKCEDLCRNGIFDPAENVLYLFREVSMSFLTEAELENLTIEQSVFHIVGPGDEHFQLLEAFDASPYAQFFLGRIKSVNGGNRYVFLDDSPVRAQLSRIAISATTFQEESEKLATAFNAAHGGASAIGAFLVFSLSCSTKRIFALLKFEDEKVLSYAFKQKAFGRPMPTFGEIDRTFVQNRNALQKAALIRLDGNEDVVCVVDRQNPQKPAAYFERFLHVRRLRSEGDLTQKIIQVTKKIVLKHKRLLPPDTLKTLSQRLYDASQSGGSVDGEKTEDWFRSIVGPLPDESPVLKDFKAELKREGMLGESFVLEKDAVPPPRNRRVETVNGVKITFPAGLPKSFVSVDEDKGEIIIRDQITLNDIELNNATRSHS